MAKIKDLSVKVRSYKNASGEEKHVYKSIGAIFENKDGGKFMMLDRSFNPAGIPFKDGSDMIMVGMYDVKDSGGAETTGQAAPMAPPRKQAAASPAPNFDDFEIPF